MTDQELEKLKFPIGHFVKPAELTKKLRETFIHDIEGFPDRLEKEVASLNEEQLDTEYRPKGWTIRQVVHHCSDSHMNSLTRFKLTLTEDKPTIKPYWEDRWAELADSKTMPVAPALQMLKGLHARWTVLLKSVKEEEWQRSFIHPEHGKEITLGENIGIYAWHCNHHLAHITQLKARKNWL
jgi:hypothetical protein